VSPARARRPIHVLLATLGLALVAAAIAANQSWLDRHFLPSFFLPRHWYVLIETAVRIAIACAGVVLVAGRARLARLLTDAPSAAFGVVVAVVLAIAAGELALRWVRLQPTGWLVREEEPKRQDDAELGWVLAPSRVGRPVVSGRALEYVTDGSGYRVRHVDEPVDPRRPSLVFGGESVMFGEGLAWDESIPAQVGATLGLQSANLAVHGYGTDQMYMRLARELPHFDQPVAVVSIFMTELFGRNLDDDRPHLGPGLVWEPAVHPSRLLGLATLLVPFRRETTVDRGVAVTHDELRAITGLARSRGATPLVVVPQFGSEEPEQRILRERILYDIPTVFVQLDADWRLPWDRHPNARAAHVIAAAVVDRLRRP